MSTRRELHQLALCVLLLGMTGCQSADRRMWTTKDSWYHPPDMPAIGWSSMRQVAWQELRPEWEDVAQQRLAQAAVAELSQVEAERWASAPARPEAGKQWFLVRAVFLNAGTGRFRMVTDGTDLWVQHGSLGRSAVPMKRKALLVQLEERPREVYVTASMAE